jgi:Domain of unknown function (DUF4062)/TIR domain
LRFPDPVADIRIVLEGTMGFDGEVFISYAHLDNVELAPGTNGWVTDLHRALGIRLAQLLGQESRIWRDPKLEGNDSFGDVLVDRLRHVAALVSVLSPAYIKSEWCQKEFAEFCKAAGEQGGIRVGNKVRIFKVMKTPVPLEQHPAPLQDVLGYEFFKVDPASGKVVEFYKVFGADAERDFWLKLFDLAHDVCALFGMLESAAKAAPESKDDAGAVYLATTTVDLNDPRAAIRRDLEQHGYTVLPSRQYPADAEGLQAAIREDLARCRLSIHMIGRRYGQVPEGATESIPEIQSALAIERAAGGAFARLIWVPPGLQVDDERQRKVIERLRMDPYMSSAADLLETPFEDLRTIMMSWLRDERKAKPETIVRKDPGKTYRQLYLVYDPRDVASVKPWAEYFFKDFEVLHPVFDGDEAEVRNSHEDSLRNCDGVLIFYGAANEFWLRQKLREVKKIAGYGRTKPMPVVGICVIPPTTPGKDRYDTHEAMILRQPDGLAADLLQPFVARMKGDDTTGHDNAVQSAV